MKRKLSAGFTLIELIVVIFIISLLSGSVLSSSWRSQGQYDTARAIQKLDVDLRRVQNMALAGKLQGAAAPGGYGLYSQNSTSYLIFYNLDDSTVFTALSVILETINLEEVSLSPVGGTVFFVPPDPTTYINGVNSGSQTFTVTSQGFTKSVVVYVNGRIDIDSPISTFVPTPTPTATPTPSPPCVPQAGSTTPTPTIDEDCDGNMDNLGSPYSCNCHDGPGCAAEGDIQQRVWFYGLNCDPAKQTDSDQACVEKGRIYEFCWNGSGTSAITHDLGDCCLSYEQICSTCFLYY